MKNAWTCRLTVIERGTMRFLGYAHAEGSDLVTAEAAARAWVQEHVPGALISGMAAMELPNWVAPAAEVVWNRAS
jgi:hypothetical protein